MVDDSVRPQVPSQQNDARRFRKRLETPFTKCHELRDVATANVRISILVEHQDHGVLYYWNSHDNTAPKDIGGHPIEASGLIRMGPSDISLYRQSRPKRRKRKAKEGRAIEGNASHIDQTEDVHVNEAEGHDHEPNENQMTEPTDQLPADSERKHKRTATEANIRDGGCESRFKRMKGALSAAATALFVA